MSMLGITNANDIILPTLSNPATAEHILSGYQAIDGEGNMLTGEYAEATPTGAEVVTASLTVTSTYKSGSYYYGQYPNTSITVTVTSGNMPQFPKYITFGIYKDNTSTVYLYKDGTTSKFYDIYDDGYTPKGVWKRVNDNTIEIVFDGSNINSGSHKFSSGHTITGANILYD